MTCHKLCELLIYPVGVQVNYINIHLVWIKVKCILGDVLEEWVELAVDVSVVVGPVIGCRRVTLHFLGHVSCRIIQIHLFQEIQTGIYIKQNIIYTHRVDESSKASI